MFSFNGYLQLHTIARCTMHNNDIPVTGYIFKRKRAKKELKRWNRRNKKMANHLKVKSSGKKKSFHSCFSALTPYILNLSKQNQR